MSQPATSTGLRPIPVRECAGEEVGGRFDRAERDDERERRGERGEPEHRSASSGSTVRSWPIIPPTSALTPTSRENCARFSRSPSETDLASVAGRPSSSRAAPRNGRPVVGPAGEDRGRRGPRCEDDRAVIARSPCPHITVTGSGASHSSGRVPSSLMFRVGRGRPRTRRVGGRRRWRRTVVGSTISVVVDGNPARPSVMPPAIPRQVS